ncbi:hypothetical protein D3C73_767650 [compost metagenome]
MRQQSVDQGRRQEQVGDALPFDGFQDGAGVGGCCDDVARTENRQRHGGRAGGVGQWCHDQVRRAFRRWHELVTDAVAGQQRTMALHDRFRPAGGAARGFDQGGIVQRTAHGAALAGVFETPVGDAQAGDGLVQADHGGQRRYACADAFDMLGVLGMQDQHRQLGETHEPDQAVDRVAGVERHESRPRAQRAEHGDEAQRVIGRQHADMGRSQAQQGQGMTDRVGFGLHLGVGEAEPGALQADVIGMAIGAGIEVVGDHFHGDG